jgi:hypothetical protein
MGERDPPALGSPEQFECSLASGALSSDFVSFGFRQAMPLAVCDEVFIRPKLSSAFAGVSIFADVMCLQLRPLVERGPWEVFVL